MLQLHLSDKDPKQLKIRDRIESMGLACEIVVDNSLTEARIIEKEKVYEGEEDVLKFMDELEEFYRQWYACRCED